MSEREQLQAEFEQLSQAVVRRNSAQFFEQFQALADEKLKASEARSTAELEQRRQAVEHLVKPLTESLDQVQQQLQRGREGPRRVRTPSCASRSPP